MDERTNESDRTVPSSRLRGAFSELLGVTKSGLLLIAAYAKLGWTQIVSFPLAYWRLGKAIRAEGLFKSECDTYHRQLDEIGAKTEQIVRLLPPRRGDDLRERLRAFLEGFWKRIQIIWLNIGAIAPIIRLGQSTFHDHKASILLPTLVQPLVSLIARHGTIQSQINSLASSHPGRLLTPNRVAVSIVFAVSGVGILWALATPRIQRSTEHDGTDPPIAATTMTSTSNPPTKAVPTSEAMETSPRSIKPSSSSRGESSAGGRFFPLPSGPLLYDVFMFDPDSGKCDEVSRDRVTYTAEGFIEATPVKHGTCDLKGIRWEPVLSDRKASVIWGKHYRLHNGYVEEGHDYDTVRILWKPTLKISPVVGDAWTLTHPYLSNPLGMTNEYRVTGMSSLSGKSTVTVLCHSVQQLVVPITYEYESVFAEGIGLVSQTIRKEGQRTVWLRLVTNESDSAVPAEVRSDERGSSPVQGRELHAVVNTAGTGQVAMANPRADAWSVRWIPEANGLIQGLTVHATEGQVVIDFNMRLEQGKGVFVIGTPLKMLVRLFDEDGQYLTHFTTAEKFTPVEEVYEQFKEIYGRAAAAPGGLQQEDNKFKCLLLKPKGNRLVYGVNRRDLRDAARAEVGFAAP